MTNLSKETKQQIALNYALKKNEELENNLVIKAQEIIELIKTIYLKLSNHTKEEVLELIDKANTFNNRAIRNDFYCGSFNINGLGAWPRKIVSINKSINNRNEIYFYYNSEESNEWCKMPVIDFDNFNFSGFGITEEDLFNDSEFNSVATKFKELEANYQNSLQDSYNNCYELIRSIRTLERIQKQFPEVDNYLPDEVILNESKESIKEKFEKL